MTVGQLASWEAVVFCCLFCTLYCGRHQSGLQCLWNLFPGIGASLGSCLMYIVVNVYGVSWLDVLGLFCCIVVSDIFGCIVSLTVVFQYMWACSMHTPTQVSFQNCCVSSKNWATTCSTLLCIGLMVATVWCFSDQFVL